MKLTKSRLSRIIMEELNRQINENQEVLPLREAERLPDGAECAENKHCRGSEWCYEGRCVDPNDIMTSREDADKLIAARNRQRKDHQELRIKLTDEEFVELGGEVNKAHTAVRLPSSKARKGVIGSLKAASEILVYYDFDPHHSGNGIPKYDRMQKIYIQSASGWSHYTDIKGAAGLEEIVRWSKPAKGPKEQGKAEMALKSLSPVDRATPGQRKAAKEREKDVTKAGVYDFKDIQKRLEREKEKRGAELYDKMQADKRKASEEEFKKRQAASEEKPSRFRRFKRMFGLKEVKRIIREEIEKEIRESKLR